MITPPTRRQKPWMSSMRTILILLTLCVGATRAVEKPFDLNVTYLEVKDAKEIIGKWSFSAQWAGYMGLAIEFKEHEFRYWFYSDLKSANEPKYPIVGTWELVKGVVVLKAPEGVHLYSNEWVMTKFKDSIGLTNPGDVKVLIWQKSSPDTRMLTKVHRSSPDWPMLNVPEPFKENASQDAPGQPATSPESKSGDSQKPQSKSEGRSR